MDEIVDEQGFCIFPGVLGEREVWQLSENLANTQMVQSRAGIRHALQYGAVAAIAEDPKLLVIARRVLGDGAIPFRATLFEKSAEANWLVVWHQDTALPLRERREAESGRCCAKAQRYV